MSGTSNNRRSPALHSIDCHHSITRPAHEGVGVPTDLKGRSSGAVHHCSVPKVIWHRVEQRLHRGARFGEVDKQVIRPAGDVVRGVNATQW